MVAFTPKKLLKFFFSLVAFAYLYSIFNDPYDAFILHSINLVFHEAGHTILSFAGNFIHVLGGSLFQIVIPFTFLCYFYVKQRNFFSMGLMTMWMANNIQEVAIYAGDAQLENLPLLGGDNSGHDWHYLLSVTHNLTHTPQIALAMTTVAYVVLFVGVAIMIYGSLYDKRYDGDEARFYEFLGSQK